jgi:hypothetical protein
MQDKELYQQILGLSSPWIVREVRLNHDEQEIEVFVDHPRSSVAPSARRSCRAMTTPTNGAGGTSIPASSRPSWWRGRRGSTVPSTAVGLAGGWYRRRRRQGRRASSPGNERL